MRLVANEVPPTNVRETADEWIIEDVPIVRPMQLSGGYVPESNIKQTANQWAGTAATLNHPRGENGEPIPAAEQPETQIGVNENARFDGEFVRVDMRIKKPRLAELGGEAEDIRANLKNGETINVSSQYAAQDAAPGEYDGEYRANVERIIRPDSVAVLPNKQAQCSVEDGCGINPKMVANAAVSITARANAEAEFSVGDLVRWQTQASPGSGRVAEVVTEAGEEVQSEADVDNPPTRVATEDEPVYKLDDWNGDEFVSGQVVKSESEILGPWENAPEEAMDANASDDLSDIPEEMQFDNPGEAMNQAQELGLNAIHTHGEGEETVFMPGENMDALMAALTDDGEIPEGMAANMNANQMEMALTDVTPDDVDSFTDSEWDGDAATAAMPNPSESEEAAAALDAAHLLHPTSEEARDNKSNWKLPFRGGPDAPINTRALVAAEAAINGARGGVDAPEQDLEGASERIVDFLVDAPDDLFGSMDDPDDDMDAGATHTDEMSDNALISLGKSVIDAITGGEDAQTANEGAEPPADTNSDMERDALISDIVSNSKLTKAALQERCDDGLEAIHTDVMSANDGDDTTDTDAETDTMSDNDTVKEITEDELEELVAEKAEEIVANRQQQSEKRELATEIVANSAEYDDVDALLDDYPTKPALKTKQEQVEPSAAMPGRGVSANVAGDDEDEYPDMTF